MHQPFSHQVFRATMDDMSTDADILGDERFTRFGVFVEGHARTMRALERSLREQCNLSGAWFEVLLRLGRSTGHSLMMSELAEQTGVTSGAVTRLVDRMSDAGLVERQACETDRRVQWAQLTPKGLARLTAAAAVHLEDLDRHYFDRIPERELSTVTRVMDRLRQPVDG